MHLNCSGGEDSWESLGLKEIKPVNPTGNQSWIFIGRTDAEAETPILWPSDVKNWLTGKDHDIEKEWRQEEKGTTEDEMAGWHHRLDGREIEQAPGVGDGQGSLACCSPRGHKESDTTEPLKWTAIKETPRVNEVSSNYKQGQPSLVLDWKMQREPCESLRCAEVAVQGSQGEWKPSM